MKNSNNLINYTNETALSYIVAMENEFDYTRYPAESIILCKIEPKNNNQIYQLFEYYYHSCWNNAPGSRTFKQKVYNHFKLRRGQASF